jgi:hypothetical protein
LSQLGHLQFVIWINHTEASSLRQFGAEVGQTSADWRFAQLMAVSKTSAAASSF